MQDISDEILRKAAEGDMPSFETIYKAAAGFVYNVSLRVTQNKEDAEEVTQEVFLILHKKLREFRFESSFKTWVYRITANSAINYAKKMQRSRSVEYNENLDERSVQHNTSVDKEESERKVEMLLRELNPDQKACLVLRNIEGLSYEEIAQALKININTVRSRLKRARERLMVVAKEVIHENL